MDSVKRSRGGVQQNALSRDDVVRAGRELVASQGIEKLNVAAVARKLGVTSPAVYHYVSNRDDLIRRVCEHIAREVQLPTDSSLPWDERIVAIVLSMNGTFSKYPGVAARVLPYRVSSKASGRLETEVRQCLHDGGFSDEDVIQIQASLHFLVGGWLLGSRPGFEEGLMNSALLERSVRWLLSGATLDCPHD